MKYIIANFPLFVLLSPVFVISPTHNLASLFIIYQPTILPFLIPPTHNILPHLASPPLPQAESRDTSLFRHLRTVWTFTPGPSAAGGQSPMCNVDFLVEFEFATGLHAALAHQFFDDVSKRMVSAFEQRCDALYSAPVKRAP